MFLDHRMIYVGLKSIETRKCISSLTLYHHANGEFFVRILLPIIFQYWK